MSNTAVHTQKRRRSNPDASERMKKYWAEKKAGKLHPEEDPNFPGFHTTAVPILDPRDPKNVSPVGEYEAMGYKELSRDPKFTRHGGRVLMGKPIEDYVASEEERLAFHNGLLENFEPAGSLGDMPNQAGKDVAVYIDKSKTGLVVGDKISLAEAGENLRTSEEAND